MNRIFSITALLIAAVTTPASHAEGNRAAQIEQGVQAAKERLQLTDDQVKQITPVLEESIDAQRKILSRYGIDLDAPDAPRERLGMRDARAMKRDLEAVRAATEASVGDILTEKQVDEFKRMQEERKDQIRARVRGES